MHRVAGTSHVFRQIYCGRGTSWLVAGKFTSPVVAKRGYSDISPSFLNGSSAIYVDEMFRCWQQDPTSVHKV